MNTKLNAILGCAGSGKLLTNDTLVLTPKGFIRNDALTLDTEVICEDGTFTKILNIWEDKNLNIYRVSFHDNTYIDACEDHLWKVQTNKLRQRKENKYKVISTKDLLKDYVSLNLKQGFKYTIPLCAPIHFLKKDLILHPYILGYLIGNGSLHRQIKVCCHSKDVLEVKNRFDEWLPNLVNSTLSKTAKDTNSAEFNLSSTIKKSLGNLELLNSYSHNKFIPFNYLHSCVEDRLLLLQGLMDSDGSIHLKPSGVRQISFTTVSPQLSKDITFLIRSLGGLVKESIYDRGNISLEYNLSLRINLNIFLLNRKANLFEESIQGHELKKKIVDVKYIGKRDGRCIRVENPLHTYVVENFVVTHNSYYINSQIQEDPKFALRTATTGMAALNLGTVRGASDPTTINAALGFFNAESLLRRYHAGKVILPLRNIANKYKNIVIDEISLANAAILDLIVLSLDLFNKEHKQDLGLLITGDIGQLAPVEGAPIFEARCWPRFNINYLTEVKRQDNREFIDALNCIRRGEVYECLDWFRNNINFIPEVDPYFRGTTFFSTNSEVDIHNNKCLMRLQGQSKSYYAQLEGDPHPTWANIPQRLEVKAGSIIQLLYNNLEEGFANGDTAIVNELWDKTLFVSLLRKNKEMFLKPRDLFNFSFDNRGYLNRNKALGKLTVIHARLANAATIHRVQGLTLDKIQLCLKGPGQAFISKQSGMLYTALSRVKTPEGLTIVGTPEDLVKCCYVNPSYLKWIR